MSAAPDRPARRPASAVPPTPVRLAGVLITMEGVCAVGFAGYLTVRAASASLGIAAVLGEAGVFVLIGALILALGAGLLRGRFWARTPGIVIQALLLPAVYSLLGPSRQVLAGVLAGVLVVAALMLLLSEPARRWAEDLDEARRRH